MSESEKTGLYGSIYDFVVDYEQIVGVKLCVPGIVKRVNMQVYNFLMRLNETRSVLWHKSCKCVCKLNSSVCNNKQIWNSDTCKCDCNEDFASIISCTKGYMWNQVLVMSM